MSEPEIQTRARRFTLRRLLWALGGVLLICAALLVYRPLLYQFTHVITDDAYIGGALVTVAPSVPGRLAVLAVAEGDTVAQGQLIASLNDGTYRALAAQAEAAVAYAQSRAAEAEISLESERRRAGPLAVRDEADLVAARARLSAAEAALEQAEGELKRIVRLSESGLVAAAQLDAALTLRQTRRAELDAVREGVHKAEAARELTDGHLDAVRIQHQRAEAARAEHQLAEAELEAARIRLRNTRLYSPVRGIVARVAANPGELLEDRQAVCMIRDLEALWVVANVEETEIRKVRRGQAVRISVDAYPGRTFEGRVLDVGSVTGSQFALIPRESRGGNFVKVVQRVPVRISVSDPAGVLKLGLSAVVGIDIQSPEQHLAP